MYEKIPISNMDHAEWLALRKTGIGGSDAAVVYGLNPYSSPMKLFYDKTGKETEEQENEAMRQGRDLEDYVAQRFMKATGLKVRRFNYMYRKTECPFMIADVDRFVAGEERIDSNGTVVHAWKKKKSQKAERTWAYQKNRKTDWKRN